MSDLVKTHIVCWLGDGAEYAFERSDGYAVQVEQELIDRAARAKAEYEDVQGILGDLYDAARSRGERSRLRKELLDERTKIDEQLRELR